MTSAFAVAWRIGGTDQERHFSWATSFLSAAIFVLLVAATLAASLHHHVSIHHTENTPGRDGPDQNEVAQ